MPHYAYVVKDNTGKTHSGMVETESRSALIEQLWKREFIILSIDEQAPGKSLWSRLSEPRVTSEQLVIFSRQLATMVGSGIPIAPALSILAEQIEEAHVRAVLKRLRSDIEAGASLSEAIGRHPRIFSELFVNMVRAGESSGSLDEILDRLAGYLEQTRVLQRKVRASLFYPAVVSAMAFAITVFLIVVVVPKFKEIFHALGGELPLATTILLAVSDVMGRFLLLEVGGCLLAGLAFRCYVGTPAGRAWRDQTVLAIPIIGKLLRKVAIARFARTLATLVKSGVPILTALDIVAKTAGNTVIERAVLAARSSIKEGENIADPLAHSKVFPPMVTRMVAVGEKTGELERMLTKIADFYEAEIDAAVSGLTSVIEPLVIAVLGLIIGGVVIALFLPVFSISTLVSR